MELLEKDEEYISSLLKQGKKVEAIAFVKNKTGMNLKEAKNYTDNLILKKNVETKKESSRKWNSVYDEKLNTFVPDLARQKKVLKIMKGIFLILLLFSLVQLIFLDRSSDIKMIIFSFSILGILVLMITLPLGSLSIRYIENKLQKLYKY